MFTAIGLSMVVGSAVAGDENHAMPPTSGRGSRESTQLARISKKNQSKTEPQKIIIKGSKSYS
jgi:hypothetical protein